MDQADLFRHALGVLERLTIPYMVVGSFASFAYGEPRFTHDIDIVIDGSPAQIEQLCAEFPTPEFYASHEAALDALRRGGQFNVIHPDSGNKIDFMIARKDAWGCEQMSRRQRVRLLPTAEGFAARPEDIILSKMLYFQEGGSEKHLRDITGILKVSGDGVNRDYVSLWAERLRLTEIWQAILDRLKLNQNL